MSARGLASAMYHPLDDPMDKLVLIGIGDGESEGESIASYSHLNMLTGLDRPALEAILESFVTRKLVVSVVPFGSDDDLVMIDCSDSPWLAEQ